jgi:transposase
MDMREDDKQLQSGMFSYVSSEQRVPADHPLRAIRAPVDEILARMSKQFDASYSEVGRPSIPPERILRALLLQAFYTIRSERLLMEEPDYNLRRITLGADKAYDTRDFVNTVRELGATPHVAQNNTNRGSAIDERTTRHAGYGVSLSKRWLVEKPFGWMLRTRGRCGTFCTGAFFLRYLAGNPVASEGESPW